MKISGINGSGIISSGGGADEEHKRIIARLLALGVTPSGNKASDRAKLREIEMQQLKTELGTTGKGSVNKSKFVTISASEIEQMKEKLQATERENKPKSEEMEKRTGAQQQALLNRYFLT